MQKWSYEPTSFYEKNSRAEAVGYCRNNGLQRTQEAIANPLAPPEPVMKFK